VQRGRSDGQDPETPTVLCVHRQRREVVGIAGDHDHLLTGGARVAKGHHDGVDAGRRRVCAAAASVDAKSSGSMAERFIDVSNVHDLEQSAKVVVTSGVPGQDALGQDRRRQGEVVDPLAKGTESSTAAFG
jgi:hypothetical protein